jgi:hypothetical protein
MNDRNQRLPADDIEALLPWYAAGTLDAREAGQVEAALAADPELVRRLDLVREEMTEAIILNEALGMPSARVAEKLFSAIDRERRSVPSAGGAVTGWLANWLTPRKAAFAAGAAALVIAMEAGFIARLAMQDHTEPHVFTPAATLSLEVGTFAKVRFSPQANIAEVTRFLSGRDAVIVEGPIADGQYEGQYRVRIWRSYVDKDEQDRLVKEFQSASSIVVSAAAD